MQKPMDDRTKHRTNGDIINWLETVLKARFSNAKIDVRDTRHISLSRFIRGNGFHVCFQNMIWQTYQISVDVTAFVSAGDSHQMVFVIYKDRPISLRDISQLLGYSRVANPLGSLLISTEGITSAVSSLLTVYGRTDILEYQWEKGKVARSIVIGTWNQKTKAPEPASILPPGSQMFGNA